MSDLELSVSEASQLRAEGKLVLLDVREPHECQICIIENAVHIPLDQLPTRAQELDSDVAIAAYCHTGVRSLYAVQMLRAAGFPNARSMRGGIDAWAVEIEPGMARY